MINHANIVHKEYIIYIVYSPDRTVFSNRGMIWTGGRKKHGQRFLRPSVCFYPENRIHKLLYKPLLIKQM